MAEVQEASYKQLICPICLEPFESPKVLACLHIFCQKCICRHDSGLGKTGTQSGTIICPVCKSPVPAPTVNKKPDWAVELPTNSVADSHLASTQSNKEDPVYCEPCLTLGKQNISVAFCVTCSEYLCNTCYTSHKSFKTAKDHSIIVQSLPSHQNWNSTHDEIYRCSIHSEQYKYLCINHKEFCCSHCAIKDHRKCDELFAIEYLSKNAKEEQEFKTLSDNLDGVKKMFITLLEGRSKNLESIEQQRAEIRKSIKEWTDKIKQHIDRLETAALRELDSVCKREIVTLSDEITECKRAIAAIQTSEQMLMNGTKSDDETKQFITMTKVCQHVPKYREKYDTNESKSELVDLEFHRDRTCEGIIKTLNSFGKIFRIARRIPKMSPGSSSARTTKMQHKIQLNSMVIFNVRIPSDSRKCQIHSGVFFPDDSLVLSDTRNMKLKLFDKSFECISSLKMSCGRLHICRVNRTTLAVSFNKNINLVSAVGNTLTPLRSISVGHSCYGIASYQQNISVDIGGDGERDSLFTYDAFGKIINTIESYDHLPSPFNTHCVSLDGQKIYYTTLHKIVTMDTKGNKLNTFESNDLKGATGITVDNNGIIFCCGFESNTVILVTPNGKQLGVLLSRDLGVMKPNGLCLNDMNDMILVLEADADTVKVFKLM